MKRKIAFPTVVIVALLLPGLASAAPIAGSCGLCGDGDDCHLQQPVKPAVEDHSCCDSDSEARSEPSFGSSNCECGREAPPALTAKSPTIVETGFATTEIQENFSPTSLADVMFSASTRPPAPPSAPPAYLIDCAFLT